jgi:hypothetical protein
MTDRERELEAELERWKHGKQIEGDYVCPDSLALHEAQTQVAVLRAAAKSALCLITSHHLHERLGFDAKHTEVTLREALASTQSTAREHEARIRREERERIVALVKDKVWSVVPMGHAPSDGRQWLMDALRATPAQPPAEGETE